MYTLLDLHKRVTRWNKSFSISLAFFQQLAIKEVHLTLSKLHVGMYL